MSEKRLVSNFLPASGANTFASENFNTVLYTGNGGTQRIGGYINRGAVFNGSSSKITLPNSTEGIGETDSSFSFWVYPVSVSSGYEIVALLTNNDWIEIRYNSSGQFKIYPARQSNSTYIEFSAVTKAANNWYNIVITRDSATSTIKLYIDGSLVETNTSWDGTLTSSASDPNGLGANVSSNTLHFSGKLDQVRFFNKALSSSEVTTLYNETHASTTISTTDIFDDDSGVALYQLDGNANDTGGVSGKFGSAAHFNGSSSYIDLGQRLLGGTHSASAWVKTSTTGTRQVIIGNAYDGSTYGLSIFIETDNKLYLQWSHSNSWINVVDSTANRVNDGDWHHVAYFISAGSQKVYVDGSEVASGTTSSTAQNNTTAPTIIGKNWNASGYFNGQIDDVRIYSDVLTSAEVGYIYNNTTASIPTDNLEAYYKLDGDARDEQQLYDGVASNVTYAYDGTASNVTYQEATKFTPDFVWLKSRDTTDGHLLFDSVRGATKYLFSSSTNAEGTASTSLTSFDSNGFTLGSDSGDGYNGDGTNFVAWCWKAGGTAVSNTDGSITSSVSANQDAGFSICSWNTQSSNGTYTIGHGLSSAPELIINKARDSSGNWVVWSSEFSAPANDFMYLNSTSGKNSSTDSGSLITSTTFNTKTGHDFLTNNNIISYCFHSVDGYQKIGSYTGTGSANGNFVETGFEPAFVMVKRTDGGAQNWVIFDNKRSTTNPRNKKLAANLSSDENNSGTIGTDAQDNLDFYSDGFRPVTSNNHTNISGGTFIYLAIAADPDETTPTVENSFDVVTYTGTGSSRSVDTDFKPDFVWVKNREETESYVLFDSIRGATNFIKSDTTDAEATNTTTLTSFDSNGFSVGNDEKVNKNAIDYVAWCWKAGDHDDSLPEINTEGTIDSVVSVNDAAGFSIVEYTGTGASATVGHGLSAAPEMIIVKNLDISSNWAVHHSATGVNNVLFLNGTNAQTSVTGKWSGTNSTVFGVNSASDVNQSGAEHIAYCFTSISGYQKVGSYEGDGQNDRQVTGLGFKPRFVLGKNADGTGNWWIIDSVRGDDKTLLPNNSPTTEIESSTSWGFHLLDDGFEITNGGNSSQNANGDTHIYLAIK